jgi:hypothetical protein
MDEINARSDTHKINVFLERMKDRQWMHARKLVHQRNMNNGYGLPHLNGTITLSGNSMMKSQVHLPRQVAMTMVEIMRRKDVVQTRNTDYASTHGVFRHMFPERFFLIIKRDATIFIVPCS